MCSFVNVGIKKTKQKNKKTALFGSKNPVDPRSKQKLGEFSLIIGFEIDKS